MTAAAVAVEREYLDYPEPSRLPAACDLGLWAARTHRRAEAERWASALGEYVDDVDIRRRSYAAACAPVIRAALDTTEGLRDLQRIAEFLREEPPGTLRHDLTRWNLFVADLYSDKGHPELALPLTARLGYVVEASAWLTPALIREGELSLITGDTARAAVAYASAARLLSAPEPEIAPFAEEVRLTAERLSAWVSRNPAPN